MAAIEKCQQEKPVEELGWLKRKLLGCFKGIRLLKTLTILACTFLVIQQITTCIWKLIDIPVTTYTHFDFNKSIVYPSVTFCREPAYKYDRMLCLEEHVKPSAICGIMYLEVAEFSSQEHGLYSHPRYTSMWINYNFSHSLDDLWEDISYDQRDIFVQYGLNGYAENVEVYPTLGFVLGRCFTMSPKSPGTLASKPAGYSVTLRHTAADVATAYGIYPPGYHVYVHYTREPFTEVQVYNGGLVQNLYVNVGETMDVKLTVDEYLKISRDDDPCTHRDDYSANLCTAQYVWDLVGEQAACSGPWMTSPLPRCANYTDMRSLITAYMNTYESHGCESCPRFCRSLFYNAFVTDRQTLYAWDNTANSWYVKSADAALQTQLYIYFNSMMVSVYEERYNYDWNLFVSDLGGSIGFLLGLSVVGLMKMMGRTWEQFIRPVVATKRASLSGSTATLDVATTIDKTTDQWNKIGD